MHCSPSSKGIVKKCVRIGFGLALAFVGIAHYRDPALYAELVGRGLGPLEQVGMVWGYILPALMIIGGLLLAICKAPKLAAYCAGIALASIPAGLMLKSAITNIPVDQTMPNAVTGLVWITVLLLCMKGSCGTGCSSTGGCCCGKCTDSSSSSMSAAAPVATMSMSAPAPKKAPAKKKSTAKKAPAKKPAAKKKTSAKKKK